MSHDPKMFPPWKQAEHELLQDDIKPGQIITTEWLEERFGIKPATTIAQHDKNKLVFLRQFSDLRDSLLENHRLMLRAVIGIGYTVVQPENQTAVALKDRTAEVRRAMVKLAREISHVRTEQLSDEQRKENTDAIAKVGALRGLIRKRLRGSQE